jgi:hypothetical protein
MRSRSIIGRIVRGAPQAAAIKLLAIKNDIGLLRHSNWLNGFPRTSGWTGDTRYLRAVYSLSAKR